MVLVVVVMAVVVLAEVVVVMVVVMFAVVDKSRATSTTYNTTTTTNIKISTPSIQIDKFFLIITDITTNIIQPTLLIPYDHHNHHYNPANT